MSSMKDHYHDEIINYHDKSDAWHTGYESAKQGEKLSDNPYADVVWGQDQWIEGYKEFTNNETRTQG